MSLIAARLFKPGRFHLGHISTSQSELKLVKEESKQVTDVQKSPRGKLTDLPQFTGLLETQRVVTDQQGAPLFSDGRKCPIIQRGVSQWTHAHINVRFRCVQTYKSSSVRPHPDEEGANVSLRSKVLVPPGSFQQR